jgi:predicted nucleotidyltransferase
MESNAVRQHFAAALDALVDEIKQDRSILAAILCGSLSHDAVWAKSDIDLVLVTIDDKKVSASDVSLYADGINVHAFLLPRTRFRTTTEGSLRQSFMHSLLSKGRLLYTHDPTIADLLEALREIGDRDTEVQLLHAATAALPAIYKAHKFLQTREDLDYTALWLLYAATPLAQIEVLHARMIVDREVIPQAMRLNPSFFKQVYVDLLNQKKSRTTVERALEAVDDYIATRASALFRLLLDYFAEVGDTRSCGEIEAHFERTFGITGVTTACEYLADQGLIGKASTPVHLTKRSHVELQELAFFALGGGS